MSPDVQEVGHSFRSRPLGCFIHQEAGSGEIRGNKRANVVSRAATEQEGATEDGVADVALPEYCAGCGIRMQTENPSLPG